MSTQSGVIDLAPQDVAAALTRGAVRLVDVREPGEHAGERIAGSELRPLSRFDASQIERGDGRVIVYCRSGKRSREAARQLVDAGWSHVEQLTGGIESWKAAGLPVEGDAGAPISLERQVRIAAGSLVAIGTALGWFVTPWALILPAFVGCGLVFAGVTDTCGMGMLLARLPYNQRR